MKTKTIKAILLQVMLLSLLSAGLAGAEGSAGGGAVYLREGLGARVLGMGNAGTAASESADAAYWNPAALVALGGVSLASQTAVLGMDRSWNFLNICYPFRGAENSMALGVSWIRFSAGEDIEFRTINTPEPENVLSDAEQTVMFSGAYEFAKNLSLGVNVKLLSHQLGVSYGKGMGFDLSLWNAPSEQFRWGLMAQDIFSSLSWSDTYSELMPTVLRLGAEYLLADQTLRLAGDVSVEYAGQYQAVSSVGYHAGVEYKLAEDLSLRAGWDTDRWTVGAGLLLVVINNKQIWLDYALAGERLPGSGPTHLFSLTMDTQKPSCQCSGIIKLPSGKPQEN